MITPFKVVTGISTVKKQPFAQLYQHIKQRDPKLSETLDRLAVPEQVDSSLSNPLQSIQILMQKPMLFDFTNSVPIVSNLITDQTNYFPVVAVMIADIPTSGDSTLDIQVSHDSGVSYASIFPAGITCPGGSKGPSITTSFTQGTYFKNLDFVRAQLLASTFDVDGRIDGFNLTCILLIQ